MLASMARTYERPPWRIELTRRPGVASVAPGGVLADLVARTLDTAGAPSPATCGLVLADDAELTRLNERAMGIPEPTDVLAFPLLPVSAFPPHPAADRRDSSAGRPTGAQPGADGLSFVLPPGESTHLGEIVVSVERAVAQAEQGRGGQTGDVRWSAADELRLLVAHGVLHLCGWDHAGTEEGAAMRALERELLVGR